MLQVLHIPMRFLWLIIVIAAFASAAVFFTKDRKPATAPAPSKEPSAADAKVEATGSISGVLKDTGTGSKLTRNLSPKVRESEIYPMHYIILVSEAMKSFQVRDF